LWYVVVLADVCTEDERIPSSDHAVKVSSNEHLGDGLTNADIEPWTPSEEDKSPLVTFIFKVSGRPEMEPYLRG
jgi:hypothetical protein